MSNIDKNTPFDSLIDSVGGDLENNGKTRPNITGCGVFSDDWRHNERCSRFFPELGFKLKPEVVHNVDNWLEKFVTEKYVQNNQEFSIDFLWRLTPEDINFCSNTFAKKAKSQDPDPNHFANNDVSFLIKEYLHSIWWHCQKNLEPAILEAAIPFLLNKWGEDYLRKVKELTWRDDKIATQLFGVDLVKNLEPLNGHLKEQITTYQLAYKIVGKLPPFVVDPWPTAKKIKQAEEKKMDSSPEHCPDVKDPALPVKKRPNESILNKINEAAKAKYITASTIPISEVGYSTHLYAYFNTDKSLCPEWIHFSDGEFFTKNKILNHTFTIGGVVYKLPYTFTYRHRRCLDALIYYWYHVLGAPFSFDKDYNPIIIIRLPRAWHCKKQRGLRGGSKAPNVSMEEYLNNIALMEELKKFIAQVSIPQKDKNGEIQSPQSQEIGFIQELDYMWKKYGNTKRRGDMVITLHPWFATQLLNPETVKHIPWKHILNWTGREMVLGHRFDKETAGLGHIPFNKDLNHMIGPLGLHGTANHMNNLIQETLDKLQGQVLTPVLNRPELEGFNHQFIWTKNNGNDRLPTVCALRVNALQNQVLTDLFRGATPTRNEVLKRLEEHTGKSPNELFKKASEHQIFDHRRVIPAYLALIKDTKKAKAA